MPDRQKNGNVSDAELNALLAEWAEAEIEPPAGFHEQTMNRLRAEVQPAKKNNVIALFAKNRRWTSIAAAAVLMLFCVPVVQGQLGQNPTDKVMDTQQMQVAQNNEAETGEMQPQEAREEKQTRPADKQAVMSSAVIPEVVQDTAEAGIAVAQMPAEGENLPTAAFSPDEETGAVNMTARMAEPAAAYSYVNDEDSLETLEQKLADLEAMLLAYQQKLAENPDDANLQEIVAEQQKAIDELKTKIEERNMQETEQQAE